MTVLIVFCFRSVLLFFFTLFWNEIVCRINPGIDMINSWISLSVLFFITYVEYAIIRPKNITKNNKDNDDKDDHN
jgi:hypothetical protein